MDQPSPCALESLLATERAIWRGERGRVPVEGIPSGYPALDEALPDGGWSTAGVTELLVGTPGIGELSLLLPALRGLTAGGRWVALVNPPHLPYAPALANAGVGLERLLVVDGGDDGEALWAAEQLSRAGSVAMLALWVTRTTPARQRRLQLAAERGCACTVAYRPLAARAGHSPVAARLALGVRDGRLVLDIIKLRGGHARTVLIEPAAFDAAQGVEWPLPSSARVEAVPDAAVPAPGAPSSVAALAPKASSDRAARCAPPRD